MDETKTKEPALARMRAIILAMVSDGCSAKTATEIARMTDTPISSAIRNLENLRAIGWVKTMGEYYVIGEELIAVSRAFIISFEIAVKKIKLDMHMVELQAHDMLNNKS
jgi:DNA-binding IclR family transcriptional regulator